MPVRCPFSFALIYQISGCLDCFASMSSDLILVMDSFVSLLHIFFSLEHDYTIVKWPVVWCHSNIEYSFKSRFFLKSRICSKIKEAFFKVRYHKSHLQRPESFMRLVRVHLWMIVYFFSLYLTIYFLETSLWMDDEILAQTTDSAPIKWAWFLMSPLKELAGYCLSLCRSIDEQL